MMMTEASTSAFSFQHSGCCTCPCLWAQLPCRCLAFPHQRMQTHVQTARTLCTSSSLADWWGSRLILISPSAGEFRKGSWALIYLRNSFKMTCTIKSGIECRRPARGLLIVENNINHLPYELVSSGLDYWCILLRAAHQLMSDGIKCCVVGCVLLPGELFT
jgi:hypothetical protein